MKVLKWFAGVGVKVYDAAARARRAAAGRVRAAKVRRKLWARKSAIICARLPRFTGDK